jgi:hypothetical protein
VNNAQVKSLFAYDFQIRKLIIANLQSGFSFNFCLIDGLFLKESLHLIFRENIIAV